MKTRVIGIDPAPSKAAAVFDGKELESLWPRQLHGRISSIDPVLVCWDAPLTGPPDLQSLAPEPSKGSRSSWYSQRILERFFSCKDGWGKSLPEGISVLPYSGCSHWAVSRAVVGHPRVGLYDAEPPLPLLTEGRLADEDESAIVEVHPALAIWIWLGGTTRKDWRYKKSKKVFESIKKALVKRLMGHRGLATAVDAIRDAKNDDELDAVVAYCLGWLWLNERDAVTLLGSKQAGAMLLPIDVPMSERFSAFEKKELTKPNFAAGEP